MTRGRHRNGISISRLDNDATRFARIWELVGGKVAIARMDLCSNVDAAIENQCDSVCVSDDGVGVQ